MQFTNEALRVLEHLAMAYDAWRAIERERRQIGPTLTWKTINGLRYLYQVESISRATQSQGRDSAENIARYTQWAASKAALDQRTEANNTRLAELAVLYKALRLPVIAAGAADVLREADVRGLVGEKIMVVGTLTMPAYELAAQERFMDEWDATDDLDLSWLGGGSTDPVAGSSPLLDCLKQIDPTYTVNQERSFQARNAVSFEVEWLAIPGSNDALPKSEGLRPLELQSQAWLVGGMPVDEVVMDRRGRPARIFAPDPRLMGLHKAWLAEQEDRNPRKKTKDREQSARLLRACGVSLRAYPLSPEWLDTLPSDFKAALQGLGIIKVASTDHFVGQESDQLGGPSP